MKLKAPASVFSSAGFCPGCGHGLASRLIGEVAEELGIQEKLITVVDVACCSFNIDYWNFDTIMAAHGRDIPTAVGVKHIRPECPVMAYMGDGAAYSIGMAETIHAALRNDNICVFVINNSVFGMTGGQMAPTTLIGQKTTTCVDGRTIEQAGMPMRMCELISCQDRAVYVERVSLDSPANVRKAKSAIRRAFKVQDLKLGFAFVEFLSICPTNWGLTAPKAMEWLRENMMPYYPVKQFKCPEEVKEVK